MTRHTLTTLSPENNERGKKRPSPAEQQALLLPITTPTQQHQHQSEGSPQPNSLTGMHFPGKSLSGAKRQRQSTLAASSQTAKRDPKMDPRRILQQPPQQSAWFQNHLRHSTGAYTESGIARRFGSLKGITEKAAQAMQTILGNHR